MVTFKELARIAERYGYDPNHNLRYLALAELVRRYAVKDLLVLGCGKGVLEYVLPDDVKCLSVDVDASQIGVANELNRGKANREFIVSDIFALPKEYERRFGAVVISEVIEHIKDDRAVLTAVHRFIDPENGIFILTVPNINRLSNILKSIFGKKREYMSEEHLREYGYEEARHMLTSCGFNPISSDFIHIRLPKDDHIGGLIPLNGKLRRLILRIFPRWATYMIFVSRPLGGNPSVDRYAKLFEKRRIKLISAIYRTIPFKKTWRVADIGSGAGIYADIIKPLVGEVTCLDASSEKVGVCRAKGYSAVCHDLNRGLPYRDQEFDFANALEIVEHLDRPEDFLQELHRIIKPGGYLLISTVNRGSPEGFKGKIVEKFFGHKWDAWDPTHKHLFLYSDFIRMLETHFDPCAITGYYFGAIVFGKNIPPLIWRISTSCSFLRRFGFYTIVLARNR